MKRLVGFVVFILIPGLILTAAGLANFALAQSWPSKPIRLVIAQAPGSATDVISRVVANPLSEALGQPIVTDARPGAGGALGTEVAARSAPDGYTLFMANNSTHGSNPAGTPAPIVARLSAETVKALGRAEVKATLGAQGLEVASSTPEQFAEHIKREIARFTKIAKAAGIKAE